MAGASQHERKWDRVLTPMAHESYSLSKIIKYRDLIAFLARRDLVAIYKQTVLGPLWLLLQPLIQVLVFYFVFGRLAGISTGGVPAILFYLAGLTFWQFFSSNLKKTSNTFVANQHIFGKVYFPRIVMPLAAMFSNLAKMGLQFLLFLAVWLYYFSQGAVAPGRQLILLPLMIIILALLGLGGGLVLSSLTVRYRDIRFVIDTAVQVLFYLSPVIYPLAIAEGWSRKLLLLNPMAPLLEAIRYMFLGEGVFNWPFIGYSLLFSLILFFIGLIVFRRTGQNFIDTI